MKNNQLNNCITSAMMGDAIGFHVECADEVKVKRLVELIRLQKENLSFDVLKSFELKDWITEEIYSSGQITDDSQSMLALTHAFIEHPDEPYKSFADNMLELFEKERMVAYGHTTKNAIMHYKEDKNWENSGETETTSNGSAMRVAPLAILFKDKDEEFLDAVYKQSKVTHNNNISILASVALATTVLCVANNVTAYNDIVSKIMYNLLKIQEKYEISEADITVFIPYLNYTLESLEDARIFILGEDSKERTDQEYGISTYAPSCVFWSIYCYCLNVDDFWNCLADAISIGGDTDTVASMACAIFGAHQLPENSDRFSSWLHDHEKHINLF